MVGDPGTQGGDVSVRGVGDGPAPVWGRPGLLCGDFQFPVWDAPVPSALTPTVGTLAAAWGALSLVQGHPEPSSGDSRRVLSRCGVHEHPGGIPASLTCPKAITPTPQPKHGQPDVPPCCPITGDTGGALSQPCRGADPLLAPPGPIHHAQCVGHGSSQRLHPAGGAGPAVLPVLGLHHLPVPGAHRPHRECCGDSALGALLGGGTAGLGTSPGCLGCPRGTPVPSPSPQGRCARPPAADLSAGQAGRRMTHGA